MRDWVDLGSADVSRRGVLLGLVGVLVAGCTAPGEVSTPSPSAVPTPTPTPTPTPISTLTPVVDIRPRWPLTGALLDDPAAAAHAAVAVKVPDTKVEHPQLGINDADLVFVELDGYLDAAGDSSTRLVPVFHSRMPDAVGAVRSLRPVDVALLAPIHAVIGSTGAAGWVERYLGEHQAVVDAAHTYLATKGTGAYSIDQSRVRTVRGKTYFDRAVMCHPAVLGRVAGRFAEGPPQVYLPWATSDDAPSTDAGSPANHVVVPWKRGDSYAMTYDYDASAGLYRRSMPWGEHVLEDGSRVTTDNILVVKAGQERVKLTAGEGGAEPMHLITDASGTFIYCHGGRAVSGTWTKGGVEQPFGFTLADGSPLRVAPGRTFVELPGLEANIACS